MKRLTPSLKSYDWGLASNLSVIADFAKHSTRPDFSEAWWGSHPSGPAFTEDHTALKNVPYLLKLISVGRPLSLQLHPDAQNARRLHELAPDAYPDTNPKPEIAIALTPFEVLCGTLPDQTVRTNLESLGITNTSFADLLSTTNTDSLEPIVEKASRINPTVAKLAELFPHTAAVLAPLFLNCVSLQQGQAIVIPPNEPHCYLSGQAVECMVSSDNVVRAGLTTKWRDLQTFFSLCDTVYHEPNILTPQTPVSDYVYRHPALPFTVRRVVNNSSLEPGAILIVVQGEGNIYGSKGEQHTQKGDAWLVEENCHLAGADIVGFTPSLV